jgi:hypothetical protein
MDKSTELQAIFMGFPSQIQQGSVVDGLLAQRPFRAVISGSQLAGLRKDFQKQQ